MSASNSAGGAAAGFMQSRFWARFKARFGWAPIEFELEGGRRLSVLVRRLPAGFCFAYVPRGPETPESEAADGDYLTSVARAVAPRLPPRCLFLRFDPGWRSPAEIPRPSYGPPLRKAADVQPPDTVILSLAGGEDELLAGMKPKWRYNIRLAAKRGVVVTEEGAAALDAFYELYKATSKRDGIALHPLSYYRALFDEAAAPVRAADGEPEPALKLWVARHEGEAIASIITLFYGDEAVYLYGASSDEKRSLMPAYALQWEAIRAAKEAGCSSYDFFGIPPDDDPSHPMHGLYRFKTGFGGDVVRYPGAWDYPLHGPAYGAFRLAEGARLFWHKKIKKTVVRLRRRSGDGERT